MVYCISVCGAFETNCYIYAHEKTRRGFLIDPAAQPQKILDFIGENNLVIEKILITHGHFDHIGAAEEIAKILDVKIYAHKNCDDYLLDPAKNLSQVYYHPIIVKGANHICEGEIIWLDANQDFSLKVFETPGHTEDSVIFYSQQDKIAFVGDTIFKGSIGNYTFPGGNFDNLMRSIKEKIFALPDDTVLFSGHSDPTTVLAEKRNLA